MYREEVTYPETSLRMKPVHQYIPNYMVMFLALKIRPNKWNPSLIRFKFKKSITKIYTLPLREDTSWLGHELLPTSTIKMVIGHFLWKCQRNRRDCKSAVFLKIFVLENSVHLRFWTVFVSEGWIYSPGSW